MACSRCRIYHSFINDYKCIQKLKRYYHTSTQQYMIKRRYEVPIKTVKYIIAKLFLGSHRYNCKKFQFQYDSILELSNKQHKGSLRLCSRSSFFEVQYNHLIFDVQVLRRKPHCHVHLNCQWTVMSLMKKNMNYAQPYNTLSFSS